MDDINGRSGIHFTTKGQGRVAALVNILLFLSFSGFSILRHGLLSYGELALFIMYFVFNVVYYAIKERYFECILFLSLMLVFLYTIFNFVIFAAP